MILKDIFMGIEAVHRVAKIVQAIASIRGHILECPFRPSLCWKYYLIGRSHRVYQPWHRPPELVDSWPYEFEHFLKDMAGSRYAIPTKQTPWWAIRLCHVSRNTTTVVSRTTDISTACLIRSTARH